MARSSSWVVNHCITQGERMNAASQPNGVGYMDGRYLARAERARPMTDPGFKLCDMNRDRFIGGGLQGPVTQRLSDVGWAMHDEPGMSSPASYET